MKKSMGKRIAAAVLAGVMTASLAACGSKQATDNSSQPVDGEFVYVPEYHGLNPGADCGISDLAVVDNRLYYVVNDYGAESSTETFQYLELASLDAEPVVVQERSSMYSEEEGYTGYTVKTFACYDGSIVTVNCQFPPIDYETATEADYQRQQAATTYSMQKTGEDGTVLFTVDITSYLQADAEYSWLQYAFAGEDGKLYVSNGHSYIWVFDQDGSFLKEIKLDAIGSDGYVSSIMLLADGNLAILSNNRGESQLYVWDMENNQLAGPYKNLPPDCYNAGLAPAPEGDVLLNGNAALFQYDPASETYREIVKWLDCDLNPDYIRSVMLLDSGDIAIHYEEWDTNDVSLVILKKTVAADVVQKETITLGCMDLGQALQSSIVRFNKESDSYRIEVRDYTADLDWSDENYQDAWQDAQNRFYNDILTGNAPDMFVAEDVNLELFAVKGIVEDLNPYLENSTEVSREDLFTSVLDGYTVDGILCTIPSGFYVSTLLGRTSEVGDEPGWTLEEMIAYADTYPDADIFSYATRQSVLVYSLVFDFDTYVDWESGTCAFDTPEFKRILEFAGRYGEEADYDMSEAKALGSHQTLLYLTTLSQPQDWQVAEMMFGEPVSAIGFPTSNSTGILAFGTDGVCISATSQHKEAAWSFMEMLLSEESQESSTMGWGFPIRKSVYDAQMEEAMTPHYLYDEDGNVLLDENGEPMEYSTYSFGFEDVTYDIYAVTEEEAGQLAQVIEQIDGVGRYDQQLIAIILEEAEPYFAGQKSVDEVADIIQSRVKMYVNESR